MSDGSESFGLELVVHSGHHLDGRRVVQTIGRSTQLTVLHTLGPGDPLPVMDRFMPAPRAPFEEITTQTELLLDAAAVLDPDAGYVTDRVWSVRGSGAFPLDRLGRIALLAPDQPVALGPSGQVAPLGLHRLGLLAWVPAQLEVP